MILLRVKSWWMGSSGSLGLVQWFCEVHQAQALAPPVICSVKPRVLALKVQIAVIPKFQEDGEGEKGGRGLSLQDVSWKLPRNTLLIRYWPLCVSTSNRRVGQVKKFLKTFLSEYSRCTALCQFLLYSKANQLYVYIYPLFFGFPSHLGHHRALSSSLCYTVGSHQLSILYIVSIVYICQSPSPNSSPSPYPYVCSLCLCLCFCFANKIIYTIFLDCTYTR